MHAPQNDQRLGRRCLAAWSNGKRPVSTEMVDAAIDVVTHKLYALGEREVDSRQVGELVMQELLKLDKVAYIRFASVYKSFQDVGDFADAVKAVRKTPPPSIDKAE